MHDYYLVDLTHGDRSKRMYHAYEVAARIVIKYGRSDSSYTEEHISEFWTIDNKPMTPRYFSDKLSHREIKWTIHNKIKVDKPIWNADFLHGVLDGCHVEYGVDTYPYADFANSDGIFDVIDSCEFHSHLYHGQSSSRWMSIAAAYLNADKDSLSYIAGVLAPSDIVFKDGFSYAVCRAKLKDVLQSIGIPMEKKVYQRYYISPIWVALFTPYMPESIRDKWLSVKKPFKADIYCPVLWSTYVNCNFPTNGIPYLMSRRNIYYKYKTEGRKTKKTLEMMRVTEGLTVLDNRIGEMVKEWNGRRET